MAVTQIRVERRYGDLGMASLIVMNYDLSGEQSSVPGPWH